MLMWFVWKMGDDMERAARKKEDNNNPETWLFAGWRILKRLGPSVVGEFYARAKGCK
jgi:hypothetical protein